MRVFDRLFLYVETNSVCRRTPTKHETQNRVLKGSLVSKVGSTERTFLSRVHFMCRAKRSQRTRILVTAPSCVQLTSMNGTSLTLQLITEQRWADNTRHTSVKIWAFLLFFLFLPLPTFLLLFLLKCLPSSLSTVICSSCFLLPELEGKTRLQWFRSRYGIILKWILTFRSRNYFFNFSTPCI